MYKRYKNKMLATALSVPVCLLSVALQTNQVKADQTVNTSQNVQTEKNNISDSNIELCQSENNSSENDSESSDSNSNTQTFTRDGDTDNQSTDDLSYMSVSVSADPKSSLDKPLDFDGKAYMLKFKVKNTSMDDKVIPKGTKFRIKVQPDSRVPHNKFLNFASINQHENDFSVTDNNDGTYDICINNDLLAGEYNFIVNFATANPGYDWDKPEGTNTKDPDVVPGKVLVTYENAGKSKTIFTDNVYIKPYGYQNGDNSGIPGYGDTGNGGNAKLNDVNEYPNETLPNRLPNGLVFRNPNDKSKSGSLFFSYLVNYQASIGGQAGAKLGIKSKDKFDLNHYHLFMDKDGEIVDITNDPLLKWTITDNEIEVDAGDYLVKNDLWHPLFLRAYVPEETINAVNNVNYVTGWYKNFKNTSLFQNVDGDMNTPFFRGVDTVIYDTQDYDAKKDVYAFEGSKVLTDKITVTDYNGYPTDGKKPHEDEYLIKYSVKDDAGNVVTFHRTITVKHNQSEIKTKDTTFVAGPNSQWNMADNVDKLVGKDGEKLDLSDIKVSGIADTSKAGDYTLTYTYTDSTGFVAKSEAIVHVVESKASIKAHDVTIYQGDKWSPETAFDAGTDVDGKPIKFDQVEVNGTVDNSKAGTYPVQYIYTDTAGNIKEADANINVLANQLAIETKDTVIVSGPLSTWKPDDNFVSAKDIDGNPLKIKDLQVNGTVDSQKPGEYQVEYAYTDAAGHSIKKTATVKVVESKASIKAHDITINQGHKWAPEEAFDGGTDAFGNMIKINQVKVTGKVNENVPGTYQVKYTYTDEGGNTKEANIKVTVKSRENVPVKAANVTIHYQDENGQQIAPDKVLSGNIGDGYISSPIRITGYTFSYGKGNRIGYFTNTPQNIIYVYTKNNSPKNPNQNNNSTPTDVSKIPSTDNSKTQSPNNKDSVKRPHFVPIKENEQVVHLVNKTPYVPQKNQKINSNKNKLPQTGQKDSLESSLLVAGIISLFGSITGALGIRKKKGE